MRKAQAPAHPETIAELPKFPRFPVTANTPSGAQSASWSLRLPAFAVAVARAVIVDYLDVKAPSELKPRRGQRRAPPRAPEL
jgi:hypothetical protein